MEKSKGIIKMARKKVTSDRVESIIVVADEETQGEKSKDGICKEWYTGL